MCGARAPAAIHNLAPVARRQTSVSKPAATAEQIAVETQPELAGQEVERQRVDAGVEELEAKRGRL